jgi:hypothetical protein
MESSTVCQIEDDSQKPGILDSIIRILDKVGIFSRFTKCDWCSRFLL